MRQHFVLRRLCTKLSSSRCSYSPLSEVLENEGIVEEDDYMYPGCQLRRNTAVGTVTGLEVFLYKTNKNESLGMGQRDMDGARVRTAIHFNRVQ